MLRLKRYLRPYALMLAATIILLFAQANLDLALPDYLAEIVNTGIQQGGVDSPVPDAIREETMERMVLFMNPESEAAVRAAYTLVEPRSAAAGEYVDTYPLVAEEAIYVLNEIPEEEMEQIRRPITQALTVIAAVEQAMANPEAAQMLPGAEGGFDLSRIPPGTDLFTLLARLPEAQRTQIAEMADEQFAALGESFTRQAAIAQVKAEYEALGVDITAMQNGYIFSTGGIMLLIALLSVVASVSVGLLSARVAAGVARDLRSDVFKKVESFSSAEFDKFPTASLITRSTNDITQMQMMTMIAVRLVFYAPIMGVGGIIRATNRGASMWWTIALAVVILLGVIVTLIVVVVPKFRMMQKLIDRLNLVARENLSGILVIRAFNMQAFEEDRFDEANEDLADTTLFVTRTMAIMMPVMMLVLNLLSIVILWVGAHQVAEANMQVGDVMAFLQYAMQIVFAFLMMSMLFIILPRASVSAERVADVLETEPIITDPAAPVRLNGNFRGNVTFRNVSFRYPGADADVLHDITFTARPGETTALIGSTGSGKSTVVNLIPRFYDVSSGEILLDGVDVREVTQHDLREKIGYVPQRGVLFSGTIASNLRFGDENASEKDIRTAIAVAQASEFVNGKMEGLAAEIAQGGNNVSGGQRQRLSIARALVKRPPIYIFDDTFSALDFKTEAALRQALQEYTSGSTILVVTQRVSTVINAEQIIVLEQGRIVGQGTHEELMAGCETYREIALSQLSMEELSL